MLKSLADNAALKQIIYFLFLICGQLICIIIYNHEIFYIFSHIFIKKRDLSVARFEINVWYNLQRNITLMPLR